MQIHKEGHKTLLFTVLGCSALSGLLWFGLGEGHIITTVGISISVVFFLTILQFFRSPSRTTRINAKHVIAPADGKVVVIERTMESEYFKQERIQVSIFMSPINVHVNRNPIGGMVKYFQYHAGKYLVAWHPKSSTENERTTYVIENEGGTAILLRQIAGALAKRIKWYVKQGEQVAQGQEFGFIKFGSRVDVFLPLDAEIKVKLGDRPRGGETVIAVLK